MSSNRPGLEPAEKGFYSEIFNQNYKKQTERGPDVIQNLQVRTLCRFLPYLRHYFIITLSRTRTIVRFRLQAWVWIRLGRDQG